MNGIIRKKYFEIWGSEEAQNVFLKWSLVILIALFLAQSVAMVFLSLRRPLLIAVGDDKTEAWKWAAPSEELLSRELKRTVRSYVEAHYNWDFNTIEKAHERASQYISERYVKQFLAANVEQIKIARDKKLKEVVYISDIQLDPKTLVSRVTVDRILVIDSVRATNPWTLEIHFEYGPRTEKNPEGIYITSEQPLERP